MPIVVDLTGVSTEGLPPMDAGDYPAVITEAEIKEAASSGEDTLYLKLSVGEEGRTMRWQTSLQPQVLWRFKRLLVSLGLELPEGEFEFDEADLVGIECIATVIKERHYKDKKRWTNKVQDIKGAGGEEDGEQSWA